MAIFRCKMCGGNLVVSNDTIVTCEYCNTKQILSKLEDEIRNKQIDSFEQKIYKIEDGLLDNRVIRIRDISYEFNIDDVRIRAIQTIEKVVKVLSYDVNNIVYDNLDVKSNDNVFSLIKRIFMFLEDGDFHSANKYCERVLDIEPENGLAYLGKLMVSLGVCLRENLKFYYGDFSENNYYTKIMRFGSQSLKNEVNKYLDDVRIRIENDRKESIYQDGISLMDNDIVDSYEEAILLFNEIIDYKNVEELILECKDRIYQNGISMMNRDEVECYQGAIDIFNSIIDYKDVSELILECENKKRCLINNEIYDSAKEIMNNYFTVEKYFEAISLFEQIPEWRDSNSLIVKCREMIKQIEIEEEKIFIRNFRIFRKISISFCICMLFVGIFKLLKDYSVYSDISSKIIGNTFQYEQGEKNVIYYYHYFIAPQYSYADDVFVPVCIDINGNKICSAYRFTVGNSNLVWKKISIYFNLDNTCNINIIDVNGDEKIYNNIPYRINLRKEIGFDFSKYDDLENGNDSFVIEEVNDELKIQMINGSGDVFEFNVV